MNEPPVCARCGDEYWLRDGMEPTKYCDPCAHERVAELEALLEKLKWISVEDRLPDLDKAVLCYGQGLRWIAHRRGHYAKTAGFWENNGELLPFEMFTDWQELPDPPVGDSAAPSQPEVDELNSAIEFAERVAPLPRCRHGKALRDDAGDWLEPSCGCRFPKDWEHNPKLAEAAPSQQVHNSARDQCAFRGPDRSGEVCGKLRYSHPCNYVGRENLHQFEEAAPSQPQPRIPEFDARHNSLPGKTAVFGPYVCPEHGNEHMIYGVPGAAICTKCPVSTGVCNYCGSALEPFSRIGTRCPKCEAEQYLEAAPSVQPGQAKGKYPIDRPCSACSAGDYDMEHHDHHPPFRAGCGPEATVQPEPRK